ncbi:MAG: roadblock/LC7 domain-containing protein [Proteobacteria bacterium]|nr:roadblock/LC7 domain-containing protein [Pseudomonadota bacterium]
MANSLVMYEEEFSRIHALCERLIRETHSKVVFLVDKNGQLITAAGQTQHVDTTSLASLTAGNVAAMGGLAKLIGESEFPHQFHEGTNESLYMTVIGGRVVLVVIFDNRTSLGLVRLRIKKASDEMMRILESVAMRAEYSGAASPFAEISDADIENLFSE